MCPLTLLYWLSYTALLQMKSKIHSLFKHMTYLMKWQSDSSKLQVGGQCVPRHAENIWMSTSPFLWDGTASFGDRCSMIWTAQWCHLHGSVEDENTTFPDFHYGFQTSGTENSHFEQNPRLKNCFQLSSNYLQNKMTKSSTMLENTETRYMTVSY